MSLADAILRRRSWPAVTDAAPTHAELLPLVEAAASVADHASLRPWRLIELRGHARVRLGAALVEATGLEGAAAEKLAAKPLRAPLLIAVVSCHKPSIKVPDWEQDAVAAGVGHMLSVLLDDAGWGVMWRTGHQTRTEPVSRMHELTPSETLLGWLYVGGKTDRSLPPRRPFDAADVLSEL
ncbi:MAG: nitroreductase family protein [Microbacteriaceae bacterium]